MPRRRIAAALAALLLAFPAAALGQSAGDDQYEDPFGSGGGQEERTPTPEPAAPAPAPETTPAPAPTGGEDAAAPAAAPSAQEQLPYTGVDTGLLAAGGAVLLAGGVALRLRLRTS